MHATTSDPNPPLPAFVPPGTDPETARLLVQHRVAQEARSDAGRELDRWLRCALATLPPGDVAQMLEGAAARARRVGR